MAAGETAEGRQYQALALLPEHRKAEPLARSRLQAHDRMPVSAQAGCGQILWGVVPKRQRRPTRTFANQLSAPTPSQSLGRAVMVADDPMQSQLRMLIPPVLGLGNPGLLGLACAAMNQIAQDQQMVWLVGVDEPAESLEVGQRAPPGQGQALFPKGRALAQVDVGHHQRFLGRPINGPVGEQPERFASKADIEHDLTSRLFELLLHAQQAVGQ
jgi:hypothetical protein